MEVFVAEPSHVPEIVEIWKEFMDYHRTIDAYFSRRDDGHVNFEKFVRELIESDDNLVLVGLCEDQIAGYSIAQISTHPPVFEDERFGLISDLAVKEGHRRKGIGEAMLARMLEWFESHNLDRIELRVVAKNKVGYSFWEKHGFKDYVHILYLEKRKDGSE